MSDWWVGSVQQIKPRFSNRGTGALAKKRIESQDLNMLEKIYLGKQKESTLKEKFQEGSSLSHFGEWARIHFKPSEGS